MISKSCYHSLFPFEIYKLGLGGDNTTIIYGSQKHVKYNKNNTT